MSIDSRKFDAYELGLFLEGLPEISGFYEPQYGDREYDYGYAEDGWPIPPPCIIDGTPMNACVVHYHD